jgi:hypothetical protein
MEEEIKLMKKIVDTVSREWPKLSPAGRTFVKAKLDDLKVDGPVVTDEEKERT